jgi:hypothetical protein
MDVWENSLISRDKSRLVSTFFLAQIVMETPEYQKLVVLVLAERPTEAPASAVEPQFFGARSCNGVLD